MSKRNKIIYWIATGWLSLGMVSTGIVQLLHMKQEAAFIMALGFPLYLLTLLGMLKMLGVIAVLLPRLPRLKEWAYAGFFFCMTGAIYSHLVTGQSMDKLFGASLLLVLTLTSWYFRPADRKLLSANA